MSLLQRESYLSLLLAILINNKANRSFSNLVKSPKKTRRVQEEHNIMPVSFRDGFKMLLLTLTLVLSVANGNSNNSNSPSDLTNKTSSLPFQDIFLNYIKYQLI